MIFDCEKVTAYVTKWQDTEDRKYLDLAFRHTQALVEAIVSTYNSNYRDELIQESFLKLCTALKFFDPSISNLHNFITTVVRNNCASYLKKHTRREYELDIDQIEISDGFVYSKDNEIEDLIIRNRERFPSVPVGTIDTATELIYMSLTENVRYTDITKNLVLLGMSRYITGIVFQSTLAYIRGKHVSNASAYKEPQEFSLLPDLRNILGVEKYDMVMKVFSGTYIRIP